MGSSRAILVAIAFASIGAPTARSQEDAGTPDPAVDPAAAVDDEGEELGDGGAQPPAPPIPEDADQRAAWLEERIATLVASQPTLAGARIGVSIVDLTSGEPLVGHHADDGFNLASNTKVLTAAAALARLGPDFRWRTTAFAEKFDPMSGTVQGDLYVRGRGDPTLRYADLKVLAHDLALEGVQAIDGDLIFDTSYFDNDVEPPHFAEQPRERAGFRAPVGALSVEGNSVVVVIVPDPGGLVPAEVLLEPTAGDYVELKTADVATVTTGRTRLRVETTIKKNQNNKIELEVTGQIRADGGPEWVRRRIDDPVRLSGELMERALSHEGISKKSQRKFTTGLVPKKARALAWHDSAPLGEIVRSMNKTSNNFIAETLLKTLGAEISANIGIAPRPGTWADGLAVLHQYLTDDAGLAPNSFRVGNGSGLFGSSDISPGQMTQVLAAAWRDFRVGPDLASSLAIMGVDGTVRSRLARTAARGRVRAKTGTLAAVSTLAGYIGFDTRRTLAFAVLVNDIPNGGRGHARALQNLIVTACIAYLNGE